MLIGHGMLLPDDDDGADNQKYQEGVSAKTVYVFLFVMWNNIIVFLQFEYHVEVPPSLLPPVLPKPGTYHALPSGPSSCNSLRLYLALHPNLTGPPYLASTRTRIPASVVAAHVFGTVFHVVVPHGVG